MKLLPLTCFFDTNKSFAPVKTVVFHSFCPLLTGLDTSQVATGFPSSILWHPQMPGQVFRVQDPTY